MIIAGKKIPGYILGILGIVLAFALFTSLVLMPYLQKKPEMDADHEAAVAQIAEYEATIANRDSVIADIEEMTKQWETYKKQMYIDADTTIDDLQKIFAEQSIFVTSLARTEETKDAQGITSSTGAPLYSVQLTLAFKAAPEKLLELLKYFEGGSNGCYYIDTMTCSAGDGENDKGLTVNMSVTLYYFVDEVVATQPATAAPTAAA